MKLVLAMSPFIPLFHCPLFFLPAENKNLEKVIGESNMCVLAGV